MVRLGGMQEGRLSLAGSDCPLGCPPPISISLTLHKDDLLMPRAPAGRFRGRRAAADRLICRISHDEPTLPRSGINKRDMVTCRRLRDMIYGHGTKLGLGTVKLSTVRVPERCAYIRRHLPARGRPPVKREIATGLDLRWWHRLGFQGPSHILPEWNQVAHHPLAGMSQHRPPRTGHQRNESRHPQSQARPMPTGEVLAYGPVAGAIGVAAMTLAETGGPAHRAQPRRHPGATASCQFKRAAVAVARKLAVIMHAMLRSGEPFNRAVTATACPR